MDYKIKQNLSDEEIKWYYQGKMLDDADELYVYDEYLGWLTKFRDLDELRSMSDFLDSALCYIERQPQNEARRIFTQNHVKERLCK